MTSVTRGGGRECLRLVLVANSTRIRNHLNKTHRVHIQLLFLFTKTCDEKKKHANNTKSH